MSEATPVKPAVLLTIISETVLKDKIVKLLKKHDITGYTVNQVQGEGSHGKRMGDIPGYNTNFELKTIVSAETSDVILPLLKEQKGNHALLAYRQDVEALID
ncbi:MAG: hypothetical protein AB4352_12065 [Hormoscilla sp.]